MGASGDMEDEVSTRQGFVPVHWACQKRWSGGIWQCPVAKTRKGPPWFQRRCCCHSRQLPKISYSG